MGHRSAAPFAGVKPWARISTTSGTLRRRIASLGFIVLSVIFGSATLCAQLDKDRKDEDKGETFTGTLVKIEGTIRCEKPDPSYALEVPDRPEHALTLSRRKCGWTKPWTIAGERPQTGVAINFSEKMEGVLHMHGFEVDTLGNGDQVTMRTQGQMPAGQVPAETRGRWSFMRGTGKFKGIRGGGSYEGRVDAGGRLTLNFEGVYVPAEMAGEQKSTN